MSVPIFEHLGYFKEYYIGRKIIGHIRCELDRVNTGYAGREVYTTTTDIVLENNKKIKAGTEVMTIIYPLNGKIINR